MGLTMENQTYTYKYPHPAIATDCVVFGFDGFEMKVLLIERGCEPYKGMWAFPGGFMRIDESAEQCAMRELVEETGLKLSYLEQLGAFSGVCRDPRERVVSIAFYALVKSSEVKGGDDAAQAQWFSVDKVPQLAFDHDYILREAMKKLKQDIHFNPIGFDLLDESFTMPQLQRLYETILGVQFDRRNFQKKMMQLGLIDPIDEDEPQPRYFGEHSEMKSYNIGALFGESVSYKKVMPTADEAQEQQSSGRKGRRFHFNKEKYDEMKRKGSFRIEF